MKTSRFLLALVLAAAPAWAGIADSPLPMLVAGKKTFHVYSVPGINPGLGVETLTTFFSCASTDTATMQVGVECFVTGISGPENDAVGTSLSVGPGATVIFGTSGAVGITVDSVLDCFNSRSSARILATSKKLICTAFVADSGNNPPTSMMQLTVVKKTTQRGE